MSYIEQSQRIADTLWARPEIAWPDRDPQVEALKRDTTRSTKYLVDTRTLPLWAEHPPMGRNDATKYNSLNRGKRPPTEKEQFEIETTVCCPACGVMLTDGDKSPSKRNIQHWRNDTITALCQSCNVIDGHSHDPLALDLKRHNVPVRRCNSCDELKHISHFYNDYLMTIKRSEARGGNYKSLQKPHTCRLCNDAKSKERLRRRRAGDTTDLRLKPKKKKRERQVQFSLELH